MNEYNRMSNLGLLSSNRGVSITGHIISNYPPDPVLPKQLGHWARSCGLRPSFKNKQRNLRDGYWTDGKYFYRINNVPSLQISHPVEDFDRWANSTFTELPMPKSKKDFIASISVLRMVVQGYERGVIEHYEFNS